ncbi:hypothetical protein AHAS_Ahas19G0142400 [Arachis hypogaea]
MDSIPEYLDLAFWLAKGMQFVGVELAVACYIFGNDLDMSEILVDNDHCSRSSEVLWTLRPGLELVDDVLNLVVGMVSFGRNDSMWWLPTTFAQIALDPNLHCKATLDYIAAKYMGMVENLIKICVPIYIERHWYLMIVDMLEGNLVYLDSLKDKDERQRMVKQMITVAKFLDITLSKDKFYFDKSKSQKSISTFRVYEPCISQQSGLDCGVWISQWMIMYDLWDFYNVVVNDITRMTIAIDLVMGEHNPLRDSVANKAIKYWDSKMLMSNKRRRKAIRRN